MKLPGHAASNCISKSGELKATHGLVNGNYHEVSDCGALQVQLDVPDASVLNALLGQTWTAEPLSAVGRVEGSLEKFTLRNLSAQHGASGVTGELQVELDDKSHLSGSLHFDVLDLQNWLDDQKSGDAAANTTAANTTSGSAAMVFTDDPVINVGKHPFDLDIDGAIDRADLARSVVKDIRLKVLMREDKLRLDPLEARDQNGSRIAGKLALDGTGSLPLLDIVLQGEDLHFGLAVVEGQDPATYPPADVEIDLHGKGGTLASPTIELDAAKGVISGGAAVATVGISVLAKSISDRFLHSRDPCGDARKSLAEMDKRRHQQ